MYFFKKLQKGWKECSFFLVNVFLPSPRRFFLMRWRRAKGMQPTACQGTVETRAINTAVIVAEISKKAVVFLFLNS